MVHGAATMGTIAQGDSASRGRERGTGAALAGGGVECCRRRRRARAWGEVAAARAQEQGVARDLVMSARTGCGLGHGTVGFYGGPQRDRKGNREESRSRTITIDQTL